MISLMQFYEGAWSATDAEELDKLIDSTIAEDHSQVKIPSPTDL